MCEVYIVGNYIAADDLYLDSDEVDKLIEDLKKANVELRAKIASENPSDTPVASNPSSETEQLKKAIEELTERVNMLEYNNRRVL